MAVEDAVNEAIWLEGLVNDFVMRQNVSVVFCDNQSALHNQNQMFHKKT